MNYVNTSTQKPTEFSVVLRRSEMDNAGFFEKIKRARDTLPDLSWVKKRMPRVLRSPPSEVVQCRSQILRDFGLLPVLSCKLKNTWQWVRYISYLDRRTQAVEMPLLFPRERLLAATTAVALAVQPFWPHAPAEAVVAKEQVISLGTLRSPVGAPLLTSKPPDPENWMDGTVRLKGDKDAVRGAYSYAKQAGHVFVSHADETEKMVNNGTLVKLEGPYISLVDIEEPFTLPIVSKFINRLGYQYASVGCGKLVVTSALRNLERQGELSNGSGHSVHPTGMAVDLRRVPDPKGKKAVFCRNWLDKTLSYIEADRRVDVTIEKRPHHFHIAVATHDYEKWLAELEPDLDPEVKYLATALYFEAAVNESDKGLRGIAAVIKNRVRSHEFPNTIVEVVAEGAAGRTAGSCQFSFMCDGRVEDIQILCDLQSKAMKQYWAGKCQKRWDAMVEKAKQLINDDNDPTGGAVLYYTGKKPYWADSDMKRGTIAKIGSHIFACSTKRGDDACRATRKGGQS